MSTIKSSDEHLTLNADGTSKDIKFQANGVEKASISSAGAFTSTTIDATALTGNLPAISAASLTNIPAANITGTLPAISGANLTGVSATDSTKMPLAGGTFSGDVTHDGKVTIGSSSYFLGNASAGYRFNDEANSINCFIIRDNGDIHYGTSNDAPWNLTGNITPSAFWDKTNGQQWFAANNTFPLALNRCNGTGIIERFYYNGSVTGDISTTGSGVSYNTSSDYRLKENVDYDWDATTRLKQLKPARFNFIADETNTLVDGFIAHEVESIVPEAVNGTKDAMQDEEYVITPAVEDSNGNITKEAVKGTRSVIDPQGIDQSKLVPLLVKTIQELEARIAALEA